MQCKVLHCLTKNNVLSRKVSREELCLAKNSAFTTNSALWSIVYLNYSISLMILTSL